MYILFLFIVTGGVLTIKLKKSSLKKIIMVVIIVILLFAILLIVPSAEFDRNALGNKFEKHIKNKYETELVSQVFNADFVYDNIKKEYVSYYSEKDENFTVQGDIRIKGYNGRSIYCALPVVFDGQIIEVEFKGTKVIGDIYKWEMQPNKLFPINDSNIDA